MGGTNEFYDLFSSKDGKTADRTFQDSEDELQASDSQRNVFISFDNDDANMINLLRVQAKDERFDFEFRDYSVKEPFKNNWKSRVSDKIEQTSAVIIAIGKNTHNSKAVDWEIREAHRQNRLVLGIRLHSDKNHIVPRAIHEYGYTVIPWNAKKIAGIINKWNQ